MNPVFITSNYHTQKHLFHGKQERDKTREKQLFKCKLLFISVNLWRIYFSNFWIFPKSCKWYWTKVVVASLNDTRKKKTAMSDQKHPFIFHNYPLLHLLKLIAASTLINLYPTQMQKKLWMTMFIVFMFFFACLHLHAHLHSLLFYVTICNIRLLRAATFFRSKNISCIQSICTDVCAEVSGDFSLQFSLQISYSWLIM